MARKRNPAPVPTVQPVSGKPAKNKPGAQPGSDDPLAVLRYEHRTLDSLFAQFALRKDRRLADRVCASLRSHRKLEEGFYREAEAIPELHDRMELAQREHSGMDDLVRVIGTLKEGRALDDQMMALQQTVEQHVLDEERTIFPTVVKRLSRHQLRELGVALRTARDKLLDETAGQPQRSSGPHALTDEERTLAAR